MLVNIEGVPTTFVTKASTFEQANNKVPVDYVGNRNRYLYLLANLEDRGAYSGQQYCDDGDFAVYQTLYKFDIPWGKIKTLNSARFTFDAYKRSTESPIPDDNFNIRLVNGIRRHTPQESISAPLIYSFSNANDAHNFLIPNLLEVISEYTFFLLFAQESQENNVPISVPSPQVLATRSYPHSVQTTEFRYATIALDYEEYTNAEITGFKHFEVFNSGLVEAYGGGTTSLYINNSGFVSVEMPEDSGAVSLYPGSGHILKDWRVNCDNRALAFPPLTFNKVLEFERAPNYRGFGPIRIYRWYDAPDKYSNAYALFGTLAEAGGQFTFQITPDRRWFHFTQSDPDSGGAVRPIRVQDFGGKIVALGF